MVYEVRVCNPDLGMRSIKTLLFDTFAAALQFVSKMKDLYGTLYVCEIIGEDD